MGEAFDERGLRPLRGEKLGGWPDWINTGEYPECSCGSKMRAFFQIDSEETLPIMFGDVGIGLLFVCEKCKQMTFFWQCG
jgi:uncharacterized protein YwqG